GPVLLVPARDRAVELALGDAAGPLDAGAPRQRLDATQRQALLEGGVGAGAARERPAGPDPGRVGRERGEEPVDVVGAAERRAARVRVAGWDQPVAGRGD